MRISKLITTTVIVTTVTLIAGGCTKAPPGYVGIKVDNYGSQRGVEDFPINTGRIFYNPFTEDVYLFPTFLQTVVWTKSKDEGSPTDQSISFNSVEGAIINADISISYSFEAAKVPAIFVEFRKDADDITNIYVRARVRDAFSREASTMKAIDIIGAGKQRLLQDVRKDLEQELGSKGFHFDMVSFTGEFRMDKMVHDSINNVIQASQAANQAEQKVRQSQAEAQQKIAEAHGQAMAIKEVADAQSAANEEIARTLTPAVIQYQALQKWNGVMPKVTGSGGIPLINLNDLGQK